MKQDLIEFEGVVTDVLPSTMFRVRLENDHEVLATVAAGNELTLDLSADEFIVRLR